jgi:hypothetical protein
MIFFANCDRMFVLHAIATFTSHESSSVLLCRHRALALLSFGLYKLFLVLLLFCGIFLPLFSVFLLFVVYVSFPRSDLIHTNCFRISRSLIQMQL